MYLQVHMHFAQHGFRTVINIFMDSVEPAKRRKIVQELLD
jgi:hypothetical protein